MLKIYGSASAAPTNKVRYVANYLNIPYELIQVNLREGEQNKPAFLKINPLAKIPAIEDNGFVLGESNAIIRYLAGKQPSAFYPVDLQQRAKIDQWMEYAAHHLAMAMSKIMFNTYYYKMVNVEKDARSFEEGQKFLGKYLPVVESQLAKGKYLLGEELTLADIAMLSALDACELCHIDLTVYPHITQWRNHLMQQSFYTACHKNFAESFKKIMGVE